MALAAAARGGGWLKYRNLTASVPLTRDLRLHGGEGPQSTNSLIADPLSKSYLFYFSNWDYSLKRNLSQTWLAGKYKQTKLPNGFGQLHWILTTAHVVTKHLEYNIT